MSKYTTEVRFICEQYAGLTESVGFDEIDNVIQLALSNPEKHIFDVTEASKYPIFDEAYRNVLNTRILKHYYTREICAETVGLWKLWLNNRMREIMPKYNALYKSALLEFNPFYDIDLSRTHDKSENSEGNAESSINDSKENSRSVDENLTRNGNSQSSTSEDTSRETNSNAQSSNSSTEHSEMEKGHSDKYSDTPQGELSRVEGGTYLTNYRKIDEDGSGDSESTSSSNDMSNSSEKGSTNISGTTSNQNKESRNKQESENSLLNSKRTDKNFISNAETYIEHVIGKSSGTSYSKLLLEFRETFINVDQMVISELSDLFFGIWD